MAQLPDVLAAACRRLLTPLVRLLIRNGVPFRVFAEVARKVYVDVAARDFRVGERKVSNSRVSVLTGLNRKEVKRLLDLDSVDAEPMLERYDRSTRIIAGWRREAPYLDPGTGRPRALPFEGESPNFSELVRQFGGDVTARAVLDELEDTGVVSVDDDRIVQLTGRAYLARSDNAEQLGILGTDVADLIATIDHNLTHPPEESFLQRKVAYDHLPEECLEELRAVARAHGQQLLEKLDQKMAEHDRDTQPDRGGTGRKRVMVGIYYHERDYPEGNQA